MKIFGLTTAREVPKEASASGDKIRRTFRWKHDDEGKKELILDEEIDRDAEIQSFLEETKIENIIRRATFDPEVAQSLGATLGDGEPIDYTEMPKTLAEAQNLMIQAEQTWDKLPSETKQKFDNDVDKFIHDYGTTEWAKKLGILTENPPETNTNPKVETDKVTKKEAE